VNTVIPSPAKRGIAAHKAWYALADAYEQAANACHGPEDRPGLEYLWNHDFMCEPGTIYICITLSHWLGLGVVEKPTWDRMTDDALADAGEIGAFPTGTGGLMDSDIIGWRAGLTIRATLCLLLAHLAQDEVS
jgi:hypothetical protein